MQILQIKNKELLNNKYDYLMILDTEGLCSGEKGDPEFDKKIALFTMAISDILLINVISGITE